MPFGSPTLSTNAGVPADTRKGLPRDNLATAASDTPNDGRFDSARMTHRLTTETPAVVVAVLGPAELLPEAFALALDSRLSEAIATPESGARRTSTVVVASSDPTPRPLHFTRAHAVRSSSLHREAATGEGAAAAAAAPQPFMADVASQRLPPPKVVIILFSPLRPVTFALADTLLNQLAHAADLQAVLVAVEVPATRVVTEPFEATGSIPTASPSSESSRRVGARASFDATSTLRGSKPAAPPSTLEGDLTTMAVLSGGTLTPAARRVRQVQPQDVASYVQMKRPWLHRLDGASDDQAFAQMERQCAAEVEETVVVTATPEEVTPPQRRSLAVWPLGARPGSTFAVASRALHSATEVDTYTMQYDLEPVARWVSFITRHFLAPPSTLTLGATAPIPAAVRREILAVTDSEQGAAIAVRAALPDATSSPAALVNSSHGATLRAAWEAIAAAGLSAAFTSMRHWGSRRDVGVAQANAKEGPRDGWVMIRGSDGTPTYLHLPTGRAQATAPDVSFLLPGGVVSHQDAQPEPLHDNAPVPAAVERFRHPGTVRCIPLTGSLTDVASSPAEAASGPDGVVRPPHVALTLRSHVSKTESQHDQSVQHRHAFTNAPTAASATLDEHILRKAIAGAGALAFDDRRAAAAAMADRIAVLQRRESELKEAIGVTTATNARMQRQMGEGSVRLLTLRAEVARHRARRAQLSSVETAGLLRTNAQAGPTAPLVEDPYRAHRVAVAYTGGVDVVSEMQNLRARVALLDAAWDVAQRSRADFDRQNAEAVRYTRGPGRAELNGARMSRFIANRALHNQIEAVKAEAVAIEKDLEARRIATLDVLTRRGDALMHRKLQLRTQLEAFIDNAVERRAQSAAAADAQLAEIKARLRILFRPAEEEKGGRSADFDSGRGATMTEGHVSVGQHGREHTEVLQSLADDNHAGPLLGLVGFGGTAVSSGRTQPATTGSARPNIAAVVVQSSTRALPLLALPLPRQDRFNALIGQLDGAIAAANSAVRRSEEELLDFARMLPSLQPVVAAAAASQTIRGAADDYGRFIWPKVRQLLCDTGRIHVAELQERLRVVTGRLQSTVHLAAKARRIAELRCS